MSIKSFIFILYCASYALMASAQASGGQIRRKSNSPNVRPQSHRSVKTKKIPINVAISDDGKEFICETTQIVDLGLSSGTLWAGWNIGATSFREVGDFFAWGEIHTKDYYSWENYFDTKSVENESDQVEFYKFHVSGLMSIVGTEYDVALAKWGNPWKLPTKVQLEELIKECEWHRVKFAGENTYNYVLFKGPNGKSIIFPNAGEKYKNELRGGTTICWCGELRPKYSYLQNSIYAYFLGLCNYGSGIDVCSEGGWRFMGFNVRAVRNL